MQQLIVTVRLIQHSESYEVRFGDGRPSVYFYFEDEPIRRSLMGRATQAEAEAAAKALARTERDRLK